jgi:hypothetical protein
MLTLQKIFTAEQNCMELSRFYSYHYHIFVYFSKEFGLEIIENEDIFSTMCQYRTGATLIYR